jgi:hypothetical protein
MYQQPKERKSSLGAMINKMFSFLMLLCVLTLISFIPRTNSLTETTVAAHQKMVPFKGTMFTSYVQSGELPYQTAHLTGSGVTSHLGRTTVVADVSIDFSVDPIMVQGEATYTAANGDTFTTTYTGSFVENPDGTITGDVDHVITGGTGRFEMISGTFSAKVVNDPATLTGRQTFEGQISY